MTDGPWIALLAAWCPPEAPVGWDDLVAGYDFGILGPAEIQAWVRDRGGVGPRCAALVDLAGPSLDRFEAALWAACAEQAGRAPRPGSRRWDRAQDRWRAALLREALAAPLGPEALAVAVESIYDRVGCPEDMLGLWQSFSPWQRRPGRADRVAVARFLDRCEVRLAEAGAPVPKRLAQNPAAPA